jgi:hypothetical protein
MFHHARLVVLSMACFGLCVTQTVRAEPSASNAAEGNGDYSYRFTDEDLLGGTLNQVGDMYRHRPKAARVLLLRPRTSLVQEIFKSAEGL